MENGSPRSMATRLTDADRMAYWLFWQCYNLSIDTAACRSLCGTDLPRPVRAMLPLLDALGITRRKGDTIGLTVRGAYLFHLVEKKYTQTYLRPMWEACLTEPWPDRVVL